MAFLAVVGVPIAIAVGVAAVIALHFFSPFPTTQVVKQMLTGVDVYVLLAIPLFILAGELMNTGGITQRIFSFARHLVGHIPGGIAHTNVLASVMFAGMSGSSVADAAGLGLVEMQAMEKAGYDRAFSGAITAASSTIGTIIPPSIPMVLYAAIAEVSLGRLFLGGIIPGLLMGVSLMAMVYVLALRRGFPRDPRRSSREILASFLDTLPSLLTPVVIIGGLLGGVFTATEAAAVAVAYALVLSGAVYRELSWKSLKEALARTVVTTSVVTFILATASAASWILVRARAGQAIADFLLSVTQEPWAILLILNVILLLLGCVMELGAVMILLLPVLVPLLKLVGIDLVHFGLVMILNLMIGFITPPFGMSLFVVSGISGVSVETLAKEVAIFLIPLLAVLLLVTYIPGLVLFLPRLVMP